MPTHLPHDLKRVLIVTHDVDWPLNGPDVQHVLARQDRFSPEIIKKVATDGFNPYFGVPKVMEIEEKLGFKSTFFFRPKYDNGDEVGQYAETMRSLVSGRWEVGLHANDTSGLEALKIEKNSVEHAAGRAVYGSRIHYLKVSANTFSNLSACGIKYDSSISFDKEHIDPRNTGYLVKEGLVVFPITFMDAYLFTYMGLTEETIVPFMVKSVEKLFSSGAKILTLLWHDNSVMMKGGCAYGDLMKQLGGISDITFLRGIDAFEIIQKQRAPK